MTVSSPSEHDFWKPITTFSGHVLGGTILFVVMLIPAVALDRLVEWLKTEYQPGEYVLGTVRLAKYVLVTADLILLTSLVLETTYTSIRQMWKGK